MRGISYIDYVQNLLLTHKGGCRWQEKVRILFTGTEHQRKTPHWHSMWGTLWHSVCDQYSEQLLPQEKGAAAQLPTQCRDISHDKISMSNVQAGALLHGDRLIGHWPDLFHQSVTWSHQPLTKCVTPLEHLTGQERVNALTAALLNS